MTRDVERDWARANPQPQSSATEEALTLWNFPIGGSAVAAEHQAAIRRFVAVDLGLSPALCRTEFHAVGHASISGTESGNRALSEQRAEAVAAFLRQLGARQVSTTWAGSETPLDASATGLAHARNRRVEIGRFRPQPPSKVVPLQPVPGEPAAPAASGGYGLTVKRPFETPAIPIRVGGLAVDLRLIGEVELSAQSGEGERAIEAAVQGRQLSPEAKGLIVNGVKGVVGVNPAEGGHPAGLKIGAQLECLAGEPEIGVQAGQKFVYIEFQVAQTPLTAFTFKGVQITTRFTGKLRLDAGPSEATALRLAVTQAGAVAGVVAAAAVINGGTALLAQSARAEGLRAMEVLAERDGVATGVAYEVLGTDALAQVKAQELQWAKLEGRTRAAFQDGMARVNALLVKLGPEGRSQRRQRWDAAYAAGNNAMDFPLVQRRVFDALGGCDWKGSAAGMALEAL
jgi:hypothetical protein